MEFIDSIVFIKNDKGNYDGAIYNYMSLLPELSFEIPKSATLTNNGGTTTCTKTGYTGDAICKYCGETLKKGETIPMLSHSYKDVKCTVCGKSASNSPKTTETKETTETEETTKTEKTTDTEATDITEKPETNVTKTGDDTPIIPAVVMLIVSLAVCGILIIKNKEITAFQVYILSLKLKKYMLQYKIAAIYWRYSYGNVYILKGIING